MDLLWGVYRTFKLQYVGFTTSLHQAKRSEKQWNISRTINNGSTVIPDDDDDDGGGDDDNGNTENVFDGAILINPFLLCFSLEMNSLLSSFSFEFSAIHNKFVTISFIMKKEKEKIRSYKEKSFNHSRNQISQTS